MGLGTFFNKHFLPSADKHPQLPEDSFESNLVGVTGLTLLAVAAIGCAFFDMRQSAAIVGSAGAAFMASYFTERDGYAFTVGALAVGALAMATVQAIREGRLWVSVHFDIARIIEAIRTQPNAASSRFI